MAYRKIVYSSALATVVAVLIYLSSIPGVKITSTGNITCAGTIIDPCVSRFNITSSNYSLKFYKFDQRLTFSPEVKNYTLYRYTYGKWRETKFPINQTKGVNYQFEVRGYKYNPTDTIKWGIKSGDAEIDPYWLGEKETVSPPSYTFTDGSIGSEFFNVTFKNGRLKANYLNYSIELIPYVENTSGVKNSFSISKTALPFNRIDKTSYEYNITTLIPANINYIGFTFNTTLKTEVVSDAIIFKDEEDFQITFGFDAINKTGLNYTLNGNEVRIDVKGKNSIDIDPSINFTRTQVSSVAITPLGINKFVVAFCDETADDISFIIFDTNGTNLTAKNSEAIDADTTVNSCYLEQVALASLNSTHFVVTWLDDNGASVDINEFAIYDNTGALKVGPTTVDSDIGYSASSVSVSAFNSTLFVVAWYDSTDQDATYAFYNSAGTLVGKVIDVDLTAGTSSWISVATFNSTHFVLAWYDNIDNDATFIINDTSGNWIGVAAIDAETSIIQFSVSVSTLNSTFFGIEWYRNEGANPPTVRYAIYDSSGNLKNSYPIADTITYTPSHEVSIASLNSTHFVVAWWDNANSDATFIINDTTGSWTGISEIDASTTALNPVYVSSYYPATDIGFCNQNFVYAFVIDTTHANFTTYTPTGTAWSGICDTTPPTYSLNSTNSTTTGSWVKHSLNWTDNVGLSGYNFSFDNCTGSLVNDTWVSFNSGTWSNVTKTINSTVGCTVRWQIFANDTSNNWNASSVFTYDTTSIDSTITLVPNATNNVAYQNSTSGTASCSNNALWQQQVTQLTDAEYNSVNKTDGNNYQLSAASAAAGVTKCTYYNVRYNLTGLGTISGITLNLEGYYIQSSDCGGVNYYVYNFTKGQYSLWGYSDITTESNITRTITNYSEVINSTSNIVKVVAVPSATKYLTSCSVNFYTDWNWINLTYTEATTTSTTSTSTTTTVSANCWTYDNVNHVLIIPSGCVYHNDTVGIIT